MFADFFPPRYLGDEERTKAAFTEDGFWKTGDGKCIFIGRAAADR
jgi:long-subunit acyl-CoA synthetase (AMP-forming)